MNILKLHECIKVENQRLVLVNKLQKKKPHEKEHDELKTEIIKLTAKINLMHRDLETKR